MRYLPIATPVVAVAALLASPSTFQAQTPGELVRAMVQQQEESVAGVDDLTIIQQAFGMEMTVYMEKAEGEGSGPLVPTAVVMNGQRVSTDQEGQGDFTPWFTSPDQVDAMAEAAVDGGTETIRGRSTRILEFRDFAVFTPSGQVMPETASFEPGGARVFVDTERLVPLRMETSGIARGAGGESEATIVMDFDEYREVSGFQYPSRMLVDASSVIDAATDMSPEDLRQQMEQARAQLDALPPEQREMFEAQVQQLERMMSGEPMEILVKDVKVNAGPPGGS